ncbi:MAG TPA: cysteine desulfurase family protein [Candidatus Saccharimonadales bacterium]|nr:cysteine desulfurase family protein [Candidatus Saccharimonadales bacterium]
MIRPIYLDYAAATPLDQRVIDVMRPFWADAFYNPSSSYLAAKGVRQALEDARGRVAHWLGAKHAEVIFTAGATESINLAIHGIMRRYPEAAIAVSAIEHEAVLACASQYTHKMIAVRKDGTVDVASLRQVIDDTTVLVSVTAANNEIGTIQPLKEIAGALAEIRRLRHLRNNKLPLYLHTDASQAGMYLDLHASRLGVDLLTLNGGKMYGPKQSGVLFVKAGIELAPLILGGGQESGVRSGTENVAACIGLATALDIAQGERKEAIAKTAALRDELQRHITEALPATIVNGNLKKRLPNNLHVSWPGIDGERLLMVLDERGVMASTGSACAANKQTASHVLVACGLGDDAVQGSLRLTLGRPTTPEEITQAADWIIAAVREVYRA